MSRLIQNIAIFTSGGDSPGMNAAIRAAVRTAHHKGIQPFGVYRGFEGLINGDIKKLSRFDVANIIQRGGTILKSARSEPFKTEEGRQKAINVLKQHKIDALIAIGGNGTYAGANALRKEYDIPIIGLPGTIDNDIFGTETTIGADTALNNAVTVIDKIRDTADAHDRVFFIEVMGRDSGFIGLNTGIAVGAEAILIPEVYTDKDSLLSYFGKKKKRKKMFSIVIVTEGNTEGNAMMVADEVKKAYPYLDVRVSILGHIQRGGSPTAFDRILASTLGYEAIKHLTSNAVSGAMGWSRGALSFTKLEDAIKEGDKDKTELWNMAKILSL